VDAKLRLKALAHEAENVLPNGLHSFDEKMAITTVVHILKIQEKTTEELGRILLRIGSTGTGQSKNK